jgi:hypothetical protein
MKLWLELNHLEAEQLFESVRGFTIDRMKTAVVSVPKDEADKTVHNTTAAESAQQQEPPVTIEQVRAVLAEKSQAGKQPEVKALISKFGANKLTDIEPAHYAELLKEAEEL